LRWRMIEGDHVNRRWRGAIGRIRRMRRIDG
jgi:hypothetical protein